MFYTALFEYLIFDTSFLGIQLNSRVFIGDQINLEYGIKVVNCINRHWISSNNLDFHFRKSNEELLEVRIAK